MMQNSLDIHSDTLSLIFFLHRHRPTITCLWLPRLKGPCQAWPCCWGPWGSGCVATAPGSWPSTTGPLHACCSWSALTPMPARWAQQLKGPPSWMLRIGLAPTRKSLPLPLWARSFLRNKSGMLHVDPPASKIELQQPHSRTSKIVAMPAHLGVRPMCSLVTCECGCPIDFNLCVVRGLDVF